MCKRQIILSSIFLGCIFSVKSAPLTKLTYEELADNVCKIYPNCLLFSMNDLLAEMDSYKNMQDQISAKERAKQSELIRRQEELLKQSEDLQKDKEGGSMRKGAIEQRQKELNDGFKKLQMDYQEIENYFAELRDKSFKKVEGECHHAICSVCSEVSKYLSKKNGKEKKVGAIEYKTLILDETDKKKIDATDHIIEILKENNTKNRTQSKTKKKT